MSRARTFRYSHEGTTFPWGPQKGPPRERRSLNSRRVSLRVAVCWHVGKSEQQTSQLRNTQGNSLSHLIFFYLGHPLSHIRNSLIQPPSLPDSTSFLNADYRARRLKFPMARMTSARAHNSAPYAYFGTKTPAIERSRSDQGAPIFPGRPH